MGERFSDVSVRIVPGKADFVSVRNEDGSITKFCICEYNAELSYKGCSALIASEHLQEVFDAEGTYCEASQVAFRLEHPKGYPVPVYDNRCEYCYAKRENGGELLRELWIM